MKRFSVVLSVTLAAFVIASCSKSDKKDDTPQCRIVAATATQGSSTSTYTFAYNDQGKIASITTNFGSGSNLALFSYTGNVVLITRSAAGVISSVDSIVLNSAGLMQYLKSRSVTDGTYSENVLTYNGDQVTGIVFSSNGGAASSTTTNFTSGNLTSITSGSSVSTYGYYTDKDFVDGDYFKFTQVAQYGVVYVKNHNLIKETTSGNSTTTFTYTYDADGKITGLQSAGDNGILSVGYTYECN